MLNTGGIQPKINVSEFVLFILSISAAAAIGVRIPVALRDTLPSAPPA